MFVLLDKEKQPAPNYDGFVVIGAGLPRTGTSSLRFALSYLLRGPCYNMMEFQTNGTNLDVEIWNKAFQDEVTKSDWIRLFYNKGYIGAVDFPAALFYRDLLNSFSDLKVVLTVRSPDSWYSSVVNSIYQVKEVTESFPLSLLIALSGKRSRVKIGQKVGYYVPPGMSMGMWEAIQSGPVTSKQFYDEWVQMVKVNVPEDRLLIFDAREGWAPLCKFLGVPIPDFPYPKVNERKKTEELIKTFHMISLAFMIILPAIMSLFIYVMCF